MEHGAWTDHGEYADESSHSRTSDLSEATVASLTKMSGLGEDGSVAAGN
jgi:hypothetical protein